MLFHNCFFQRFRESQINLKINFLSFYLLKISLRRREMRFQRHIFKTLTEEHNSRTHNSNSRLKLPTYSRPPHPQRFSLPTGRVYHQYHPVYRTPVRIEYDMKQFRIGLKIPYTQYRCENNLNMVQNEYATVTGLFFVTAWCKHHNTEPSISHCF